MWRSMLPQKTTSKVPRSREPSRRRCRRAARPRVAGLYGKAQGVVQVCLVVHVRRVVLKSGFQRMAAIVGAPSRQFERCNASCAVVLELKCEESVSWPDIQHRLSNKIGRYAVSGEHIAMIVLTRG